MGIGTLCSQFMAEELSRQEYLRNGVLVVLRPNNTLLPFPSQDLDTTSRMQFLKQHQDAGPLRNALESRQ